MSLRARLLLATGVIAVVLVAVAVGVTRLTKANLMEQVDAQLNAVATPGLEIYLNRPNTEAVPSSLYVAAVTSPTQMRTILVPNLWEGATTLPAIDPAAAIEHAEKRELFTVGSQGSDLRYRVRAAFVSSPAGNAVLVMARPLDEVDRAMRRLVTVEVVATVAILAVLALVMWWVMRLGVRPLKQMTVAATAIAAGDLSQRVPEATPGTEAGELGVALNQMLGRIEEAFDERQRSEERLRQFVADASHELRTPVTTVRGYAELYRAGGLENPDELREAMRRTEQEAVRMGALIDDMLLLARLDQGRPLERETVDLAAVVRDAGRDARAVDPTREVTVEADSPVLVVGDGYRLRQVVANVVGNALVHTLPGTRLELRVRGEGDAAEIEIVDHGQGMAPEVVQRAFERFYRGDPGRSRHRGGSGLGLSIVQATVAAHGGEVRLQSEPGAGTTVRIRIPLLPAPSPTAVPASPG